MAKVVLSGSDRIFEVNEGEVLYDALCDQKLELPHGCLSGSCGACRIDVLEGQENLSAPTYVEKDTIESLVKEFSETHGESFLKGKTIRLSCRARVNGDVTIKPIK